MRKLTWARSFVFVISGLLCWTSVSLDAQGLVDNELVRSDREGLFVVQGEDARSSVHCLDSVLKPRRPTWDLEMKYRTLCEADWGRWAMFSNWKSETGVFELLLVDVESGKWLKINDTPNIPPKEKGETDFDFAAQGKDPRDHTYRFESSSWRFDPFDGEFLESNRSRVWNRLKELDPEITDLVTRILKTFGNVRTPEAIIMSRNLENLVYSGKELSSPGLEHCRLGTKIVPAAKDHETTAFEEKFGKWGECFPDPPKLK